MESNSRIEDNFYALINNIRDAIWSVDKEFHLVAANNAFNDLIFQLGGVHVHPGDNLLLTPFGKAQIEQFRVFYERAFRGESFTEIVHTPLPVEHWAEISFSAIRQNDVITGVACHSRDITAAKYAEIKQLADERKFQSLIENGTDGLAILSPYGKLLYIAPSVEKLLGYTPEEMMAGNLIDVVHPDSVEGMMQAIAASMASPGITIPCPILQMRHKDGSWRWMEGVKTNLLHDPAVNGIVENFRDITDRKLAKEALIKSEQRFRLLIENSADGLALFSGDGKLLYIAPTCKEILGYTDEEMLDLDLDTIIHPDALSRRAELLTQVMSNPDVPVRGFIKQMRRKDGGWRWIQSTLTNMLANPAVNALVDNYRDITESKVAEEKLRHSELRLKQAQGISHTGSWEMDLNSRIITMSDETCRIYGRSLADRCLHYDEWLLYTHPDDLAMLEGIIAKARSTYSDVEIAYRIVRKDNAIRYLSLFTHYEKDEAGNVIGIFGAAQDVTNIREAEQEIRNSEHRFRALIENSSGGVMLLAGDGLPFYVSPSITQVLGYTPAEFLNIEASEGGQQGGVFENRELFEQVLANPGKAIRSQPGRRRHKDGSWRWIESVLTNMLHDPAIRGIVNNFSDVTDKKNAEDILKYRNQRLLQAQEIANYGGAEYSYQTQVLRWSEQLCKIFGFTPDENIQMRATYLEMIHPDDREYVKSMIEDSDARKVNITFLNRFYRKDGALRYAQTRRVIEFDAFGTATGAYAVVQDITDLKEKELQILQSEHRFRSLIENSLGGVAILTAQGVVSYISPSVQKVLGYGVEEFMQMGLFSIMHPEDVGPVSKVMEEVLRSPGVPIQGHVGRLRHKDGSWRWIDATVTNLLHDPAVNGLVNNFRDVTDKKLAEDKLFYANRLYAFISALNHAIVQCDSATAFFNEACRIAIEIGQFRMAWIGMVDTKTNLVQPVACHGQGCDYLQEIQSISITDLPSGHGPTGTAIRENRTVFCNDISKDHSMDLWKQTALKYGYMSSVALPVFKGGVAVGSFTFYSSKNNYFDNDEIMLLEEIAYDVSIAMDIFENESQRKLLTEKLLHNDMILRRAQEVANFGSYQVDFATRVATWSEQLCGIFGLPAEDNRHDFDSWLSFVHPDDRKRIVSIINESDTSGSNNNFYYRIVRRDGSVRNILSYRQIEFDQAGVPIGAFAVAHDITSEVDYVGKLESASRQLDEIASVHSHNVRGPLATILGLCELFSPHNGEDENTMIIQGIQESSVKLDSVIREIVGKSNAVDFG